MNLINSCELCMASKDSFSSFPKLENTILFESKYFIIVPCIGPLIEGQVMILSKEHSTSLASMGSEGVDDFIEIFNMIRRIYGKEVLLSEHGSFHLLKAGGCIEHTHIHVIPSFGNLYNSFDKNLAIYKSIGSYENLTLLNDVDFPYIMNINGSSEVRVYEAYNIQSQLIRQVICGEMKRPIWNWRLDRNEDIIRNTIKIWEEIIK